MPTQPNTQQNQNPDRNPSKYGDSSSNQGKTTPNRDTSSVRGNQQDRSLEGKTSKTQY